MKEKIIKIGAKVVSHGRYVALQMAEVAVSENLFADLADDLRAAAPSGRVNSARTVRPPSELHRGGLGLLGRPHGGQGAQEIGRYPGNAG